MIGFLILFRKRCNLELKRPGRRTFSLANYRTDFYGDKGDIEFLFKVADIFKLHTSRELEELRESHGVKNFVHG